LIGKKEREKEEGERKKEEGREGKFQKNFFFFLNPFLLQVFFLLTFLPNGFVL